MSLLHLPRHSYSISNVIKNDQQVNAYKIDFMIYNFTHAHISFGHANMELSEDVSHISSVDEI